MHSKDAIEHRTKFLIGRIKAKFQSNEYSGNSRIFEIPVNKNVFILAPHPDDEVIGCAGVIQQLLANDCRITVVVVTNENERSIVKPNIVDNENLRISEARKACKVLGYQNLVFWPFLERGLTDQEAKESLSQYINEYLKNNPCDMFFIPNHNDMHPDHRHVYESALIALNEVTVSPKTFLYEIWGACDVTHFLPLPKQTYNNKLSAMQCYQSQNNSVDYIEIINEINTIRVTGLSHALNGSNYVECFEFIEPEQVDLYIKNITSKDKKPSIS